MKEVRKMVNDEKSVTVETIGLSQREFMTLFLLKELSQPNYPRALHRVLCETFEGKTHSYDYLTKIAKQLSESGHLMLSPEGGRNYYQLTSKGKKLYEWYQDNFKERLLEIKKVIDRFVYSLTGSGDNPPVTHELPDDYRRYFSKIVSVKDLVRHITLKTASTRSSIYMGEIGDILKMKFGWASSNGYLYKLANDMEVDGSLIGQWESEKRTKRHLRLTEEGKIHLNQIANDSVHRLKEIQSYLRQVLNFLSSSE